MTVPFSGTLKEIKEEKIGIVLSKDLSHMGHNSSLSRLYTSFTFPQHGIRYIAINGSYDTAALNSMDNAFPGIKNLFNEFYTRDTSRKIRAVQKANGERGVPLTTSVPYSYVKAPDNSKHWIIAPRTWQRLFGTSLICAWENAGRARLPISSKRTRR